MEPIATDISEVSISPVFGQLLRVKLVRNSGSAAYIEGAVTAVTVYGDGRIEYHTEDTAGGAR
ncbi:hypothetical protein [Streptomyces sp. LN245]|uniref:hypothetical protein n=1 Tax=Streptomyces sp. LN245 TaxID=3112975 RepID=UPI0037222AE1